MKTLIIFKIICLSVFVNTALAQNYITLKNNKSSGRIDESFVVNRKEFKAIKQGLLPAIKNNKGEWIPCQADDLDGDGLWDELAFVYSLKPNEEVKLRIVWCTRHEYPKFVKRTNVRYGKMISPGNIVILQKDSHGKYNLARGPLDYPYQTDGPAWENDKMAFRHYFDGRNVRDVFGKRTSKMVMDSVGIRADGTPGDTYHVMAWWGRDIMSGARSFGLGGIALKTSTDSLIRLGVPGEITTDNVDSTLYKLVVNGPVRSIFKLNFYGWDIGSEKINIEETMTIWAGKYGYENIIKTSSLPPGTNLVTGIVNNFNNKPYTLEKVNGFMMMATHDKQTYDKEWYLGLSLLIDQRNWKSDFEAPKTGDGITTTWCANLKPNHLGEYRFNCYAAWELTDSRFTDKEFYLTMIRQYAKELSHKINPVLKF